MEDRKNSTNFVVACFVGTAKELREYLSDMRKSLEKDVA